ncbi:unnamed protein product, partial [Iphiclides podalirius]
MRESFTPVRTLAYNAGFSRGHRNEMWSKVRWAGPVGGTRRLVGTAQLRIRPLDPPFPSPTPVATGYRLATTYIHPAQAMPVS